MEHVLREYSQYYNQARPHQGIDQQVPESAHSRPGKGSVQRRDILGGLLHDYFRDAASWLVEWGRELPHFMA